MDDAECGAGGDSGLRLGNRHGNRRPWLPASPRVPGEGEECACDRVSDPASARPARPTAGDDGMSPAPRLSPPDRPPTPPSGTDPR
jgi:hypothetical protein